MRSWLRRIQALIVPLCMLAGAGRVGSGQVTIYRDSFGVPSIEGKTFGDALYGLGYAMAQDDAVAMARTYKLARGRLAEVDGRAQLFQDAFVRSLGIEEMAERRAKGLSPREALPLQAFCDGANRALAEQKGRLPAWVEPFTPVDVLATGQLVNAAFPLYDIARELMPGVGSNQFAVSPRRSATGHAILSIDPHLPWAEPFLWYEFALYAPGVAFRGITVPGLPFGVMGHTDRVAWCMTNNDPDLYDYFTVKANPANPKQYSYHGEWRDFEDVRMEMRWRENGALRSQVQRVRRTAWGPLVPFRMQAVRIAPLDNWDMFDQVIAMARAKSAAEFRRALMPRGLSMWNIVYADVDGHIGYQYNGRIPRRDSGLDWSKPVDGDDPRTKWGAPWTLDELPHATDPKSGLLVNANSPPWRTTLGSEIRSTGWPRYVAGDYVTTRYRRLADLLSHDRRITLDAATRYATDTLVPYALAAVQQLHRSDAESAGNTDVLPRAVRVLASWDGRADATSIGTALYSEWLRADRAILPLARRADGGAAWSPEELETARTALRKAADVLQARYGSLAVPWGRVLVSVRGERRVPMSGFGFGDGVAVVPTWGAYKEGQLLASGGSSFRMIVDLDPKGVRSWSILPFGASQDPANRHYADQMALYGNRKYKETAFGLTRARRAAKSTLVLRH